MDFIQRHRFPDQLLAFLNPNSHYHQQAQQQQQQPWRTTTRTTPAAAVPSPDFATFYRAYVADYMPAPLQMLLTPLATLLAPLQKLVLPFFSSTSDPASTSFDLFSLLLLLVIAFVSFKVLDYVRRLVMWWIMFAVKLVLVLLVVNLGLYVQRYGWEKTLRDAGWVLGMVEGWLEGGAGVAEQMWTGTGDLEGRGGKRGSSRSRRAPVKGQRSGWT